MKHLKTFIQLNESASQLDQAILTRVSNGYIIDDVEDIRKSVLNKLQSEDGGLADYAMRNLADEFFSSDMNRNEITKMADGIRDGSNPIFILRKSDFDDDNEQGYYLFAAKEGEDEKKFKNRLLNNIENIVHRELPEEN